VVPMAPIAKFRYNGWIMHSSLQAKARAH